MVNKKYVGVGNSPEKAAENLYETAEQNGVTSEPTHVGYVCAMGGVKGKPNADYGMAFASALQEANLTIEEVDLDKLEVTVTGTYKAAKKTQPKPSGSAEKGPGSLDLTDLF